MAKEESPESPQQKEITLDPKHVTAAYQFRCAQMANELAIKDAVINQLQETITNLELALAAANSKPTHAGRITRPPVTKTTAPRKKKGK